MINHDSSATILKLNNNMVHIDGNNVMTIIARVLLDSTSGKVYTGYLTKIDLGADSTFTRYSSLMLPYRLEVVNLGIS